MPATYTLIASNTLSSSAASVTFSAIPATYTDLVLRISARNNSAVLFDNITIRFNSDSATNYSRTRLYGDGTTATSSRGSSEAQMTFLAGSNGTTSTANSFSNYEIYIPSYGVSQNKPVGSFGTIETNGTEAALVANATLWRNTAAITSMVITSQSSSFVSGSSFFLYGIKNS